MEVQMGNFLTAVRSLTCHDPISDFVGTLDARQLIAEHQAFGQHFSIGISCLMQSGNVLLRDHEGVDRRLRCDVFEGDRPLTLCHSRGRNLTTYNLAEDAVFHCQSCPRLPAFARCRRHRQSYQPPCLNSLKSKLFAGPCSHCSSAGPSRTYVFATSLASLELWTLIRLLLSSGTARSSTSGV